MPLLSFFQRLRRGVSPQQPAAVDAVSVAPSDVEAARVRARRRLIGMFVLVGAGVIGFPLLFETQPRPMSPDILLVQAPVQMGNGGGATSSPLGKPARSMEGRSVVAGIVEAPQAPEPASTPTPTPTPPVASRPVPAAKPIVKPVAKEGKKEVAKPVAKVPDKVAIRYVVQFGAFADAKAAQEVRMKVEKMGVKTYAQQVDTPTGKRIRVRMGPYADKADADKAMATLRKAGLTGAVLTL
ncbi:MAG: SPOR domain-containing protein [Aquabacterium sp.]|nr:SPOR domain-containing protein [Aquabacterium sp.]